MEEKITRKQRAKQQRAQLESNVQENIPHEKSKSNWFFYILLLLITTSALFPILQSEFLLYDDQKLIVENALVADGVEVPFTDFFKRQLFSPHWKPLVYLSWNIQGQISGVKSFPFHLGNLLLHLANVLLVFAIGRRLISRWIQSKDHVNYLSFALALFFAIHPLHVESVAWATERKDVMYSFFYLLSMLCYLRYLAKPKTLIWLALSVLAYLLVVGSKAMGITLVAILFILDFVYERKFSLKLILEKSGHFIILFFAMFIYGMFGDFGDNL